MCGIVGAVADRNVPPILLEGLQRLEYRGYDSAGLAVVDGENGISRRRRVGKVQELVNDLKQNPLKGRVGIAHTRWATHGVPSEENAHPHASNDRLCVVHNGIIENFEELRDELMAQGYQFASETDSETVAHLIDSFVEQGMVLVDAVRNAVKRIEGAYAIGVILKDTVDVFFDQLIHEFLVDNIFFVEDVIEHWLLAQLLPKSPGKSRIR